MNRRAGFTLLELLLATVLTAVLMVGVLAVISRVWGPADSASDSVPGLSIGDAVVRVLGDDLAQARTIDTTDAGLVLMSYGALDREGYSRTQRPVRIAYAVQDIGGRTWLVRSEQALDEGSNARVSRDLVASGVTRIDLTPPAIAEPLIDSDDADPPVDALWRLRVWSVGQAEPAIDRSLVLRRALAG